VTLIRLWRKVRLAIASYDEFGATFATGIWVVPTQAVGLPVSPVPLSVFLTLVTGDADDNPHTLRVPDGFQHVHGANHVGGIRFYRVLIRIPYQWLGSQVKDDLRSMLGKDGLKTFQVSDISYNRRHTIRYIRYFKQTGLGWRLKGISDDICPQTLQP
jgi:hypothetical protein